MLDKLRKSFGAILRGIGLEGQRGSGLRARCRPVSRGTTMTSPACTGTSPGGLRSRTSGSRQALWSTRKFSSEKLRRGTIWPSLETFGYALQTPMSLRFEATIGVSHESQNLNFKVSAEFNKRFKRYALDHDLTMIQLLAEGFELVYSGPHCQGHFSPAMS